jgi:hypothetical protein
MEITPFEIYLIMQAAHVIVVFAVLGSFAGLGTAMLFFAAVIGEEEQHWPTIKYRLIPITLVCFFLATVIPSTKTLIAMYGIPAAIQVAGDAELDETATKSIKAINKLLDTYLEAEQ